jgi:putative DNA methylase
MSSGQPKKLIEVALPLPEINDASAYDKMPGIGPHPKGIHHWWARLPLPAARSVLFASVVTDPSDDPAWKDKSEAEQDTQRERLFDIVRRLMGKKLHEHPEVYTEARAEMMKHCDGKLPSVLDPFAGGGSIPLEAARLGFDAHAADLNPVAVLLNKCNLELVPRWAGHAPVNPEDRRHIGAAQSWHGTHGLAADVRYYGRLIRQRVQEKLGHLYPKVRLPKEHGGGEANVIAWLWARTVASQDPAAHGAHVPLMSSYWLANNDAKSAWLEPVVDRAAGAYHFKVKTGTPPDKKAVRAGTKMGRRTFRCLLSGTPLVYKYTRAQAKEQKLGCILTCIVAETKRGRVYIPATPEHERLGRTNAAPWKPEELVTTPCHDVDRLPMYGMPTWGDAFTPRQLTALTTLSDLVRAVRSEVEKDARRAGLADTEAKAYMKTVCTFLALAADRTADFNNAVNRWSSSNQKVMNLFARQAIPMNWDFAEANTLGDSVGAWNTCCDYVADCVQVLTNGQPHGGKAAQLDAANGASGVEALLVSTDPPYYDNIGYAALSDFFYVWLRRSLGDLYPDLFSTILVPKTRELTASPERFDGDRDKAKEHFESGFRHAFSKLLSRLDHRFPLTVYYAFKQNDEEEDSSDNDNSEVSPGVDLTTGWETLLEALISSGFVITATWPVRASQKWRMVSMGTNALASYIVLACRPRPANAPRVGRSGFVAELKRELPPALRHLQQGSVAPVDFAQAAIGPGMAVFSRYAAVLESTGDPMTVRKALALINGIKDELLGESIEELDKDTRWAVQWYTEDGFNWGEAGKANLLANAQATAVNGLVAAGILEVEGNRVRLISPENLPADWDPETDRRLTVWEMTHHLLRIYYHQKQGDAATAALLRKLGRKADVARDLAYKLFTVCEKQKRSAEAQGYNALVLGWPDLLKLAQQRATAKGPEQQELV